MKKLIPVVALIISAGVEAQCNKQIDPSKVMLFIDTNNSELEIATTEKAACERGQKLVVVPKNYKEYIKLTTAAGVAGKKLERCMKSQSTCAEEAKQANDVANKLAEMNKKNQSIRNQTEEALKEIKASNAKLQNVAISGHDGGGHFGGYKGGFGRQELSKLMKDFPEINEVSSLLLLGCYTGVQKEIIEWKHIFPKVKIIAGYDGSAPLSDKPHGHQYITDVLLKEKRLLANAEQKKLQSFAKQNIQGLIHMHAAMYVACDDGTKEAEFYYGSQKEGKAFRPFDIKECEAKMPEIEALNAKIAEFYSGELEPPKDTANGELRKLYNDARRIEHCGELMERPININALFNMLFHESVEKNFANFYKDDLAEAEKIIGGISIESLEKNANAYKAILAKEVERLQAELAKYEADPELLAKERKATLDQAIAERDKLMNDPAYAEAKGMIDPTTAQYIGPMNPPMAAQEKIAKLMEKVSDVVNAEWKYDRFKDSPEQVLEEKRMYLKSKEVALASNKEEMTQVKELYNSPEKPWVPTAQNLASKSRKELLKNIHNLTKVAMLPGGITPEQTAAVNWVMTASNTHLQYFQNPFSWHEFTGTTEAPQFAFRLRDTYSSYTGPGYMGGGGVGGMMGGGLTTPVPGQEEDAAPDEGETSEDGE